MEYAEYIALGVHSEYLNALGLYSDYTVKKSQIFNKNLKKSSMIKDVI